VKVEENLVYIYRERYRLEKIDLIVVIF